MQLINLKRYYPNLMPFGDNVQYYIDEESRDWFESLPLFTKNFVIAFETDTGIIRSFSDNPSRLYPVGLSVADVNVLPDNLSIDGTWIFDGTTIYQDLTIANDNISRSNTLKRNSLAVSAATAIAIIQASAAVNNPRSEDAGVLVMLQRYLDELRDVDLTGYPAQWPTKPDCL